jgi:hypothetical protein
MADYRTLKMALLADTSKFTSGMNRAERQTKTFGSKINQMGKTAGRAFANLGIAAGLAAVAIGVEGVKAAIADQKEQATLAKTLQNTTKATNLQIKSVEKYIEKTQFATGVTDTDLRKSLDRLVRSTGSVTKAQKIQALALDVSAGTGKDLESVTNAIAKAYDGNYGSLKRLGVPISDTIMKTKDFDAAQKELNKTFGGQSEIAANTMEGRMKRLTVRFDEAKESIGAALLEGLEPLFAFMESPAGQKFIDDFVVVFANAMKLIAELLPGIVKEMGKFVGNVGNVGLMGAVFSDPKLATAALAYGAGFLLGGPTGGALAALAAYAAVSAGMASADAGSAKVKGKAISGATIKIPGISETGADRTANQNRVYGGLTSNLNSNPAGSYGGVMGNGNVNITVNALDPAAAARAIQQALNKANRMGVSRLTGAAG